MKASHLSMCDMTVRRGSLAESGLVFRSILNQINEFEYTSETQEGLFSWVHTKMGFSSDSMCWHIAKALRLQFCSEQQKLIVSQGNTAQSIQKQ